jgi:hypothetical protein
MFPSATRHVRILSDIRLIGVYLQHIPGMFLRWEISFANAGDQGQTMEKQPITRVPMAVEDASIQA